MKKEAAKSVIAIVPARGGSKGIPGKNLYPLAGKPLIVHTIEQALAAQIVSEVIVSTDSDDISGVSIGAGATVIQRPVNISGDSASSESALLHVIDELAADPNRTLPEIIVFLQCTSPIRAKHDIDRAIELLLSSGSDSVLSVVPNHRFLWTETEQGANSINYDFRNRPRRQEMLPQYAENGSIYVFRTDKFMKSGNRISGRVALYKMDERSAIDIDSLIDMQVAELFLLERMRKTDETI